MDEYGQELTNQDAGSSSSQPKEKQSVWDTLGTGIDKFFTFRTTQEQQKIEELRLKQLEQQGLIEGEETKRSAISVDFVIFVISLLSISIICGLVPKGAITPYQVSTTNSGNPNSTTVGTSGSIGFLFCVKTASARS